MAPLVDLGGREGDQVTGPGNAVDEEPGGPGACVAAEDGVR